MTASLAVIQGPGRPKPRVVFNGEPVISGYQDPVDGGSGVTAGVSSEPGLIQVTGSTLYVSALMPALAVAHAILLGPARNSRPRRIDFSEDNGGDKQTTYAALHYGTSDTQVQRQTAVNLTLWHTLGVNGH